MKSNNHLILILAATALLGCGRHVRTAYDITPGNPHHIKLDCRYGAGDIRIQTCKLTAILMDRWYSRTGYEWQTDGKPRLMISQVENRTDSYISTDMIRDIFESIAIDDGRFTVVVGDKRDEAELDTTMDKIAYHPKYDNPTKLETSKATAPRFLAKVRITKATTQDRHFDYDDYRMTVTLYDIETQEAVDSARDVLSKRVGH